MHRRDLTTLTLATICVVAIGATRPPFPRAYVGVDGVERPVSFEQQLETVQACMR